MSGSTSTLGRKTLYELASLKYCYSALSDSGCSCIRNRPRMTFPMLLVLSMPRDATQWDFSVSQCVGGAVVRRRREIIANQQQMRKLLVERYARGRGLRGGEPICQPYSYVTRCTWPRPGWTKGGGWKHHRHRRRLRRTLPNEPEHYCILHVRSRSWPN